MTASQWNAFYGWCAHQHVPENDHGDAGNMNFARVLELANAMEAVYHIVTIGDTLWSIAHKYRTTVEAILTLNPTLEGDIIALGLKLRVK